MAVSAKAQVKKILSSKSFTGKQAAHLILKDSVEVDHGRPGILTPTELQRLKQNLQGHEVDVYNSWIRAYQVVDYSVKEATIMALQAKGRLLATTGVLFSHLNQEWAHHDAEEKPQIVTQKQLEDIQKAHREEEENALEPFSHVVVNAASDLVEEAAQKYPEEAAETIREFLHYVEFTDEDALPCLSVEEAHALLDEIFKASALRLLEGAEAGTLTPFTLTKAELSKRQNLQQALRELGYEEDARAEREALHEKLRAFDSATSLKGFKRAEPKKTMALVKRIRDALEDGSFTFQEEPEWIEGVFFRGQNLIEAGLPWYADEALKATAKCGLGFAVLLDPSPGLVDEAGYYRPVKGFLSLGTPEGEEKLEMSAQATRDTIFIVHRDVRKQIRHFLGYQAVIEAVSEAIGVNLGESIEAAHQDLLSTVENHHQLLELASNQERLKGLANLRLDIEALRPSKKTMDYIRERLSLSLGDNWWTDVATALNQELESSDA